MIIPVGVLVYVKAPSHQTSIHKRNPNARSQSDIRQIVAFNAIVIMASFTSHTKTKLCKHGVKLRWQYRFRLRIRFTHCDVLLYWREESLTNYITSLTSPSVRSFVHAPFTQTLLTRFTHHSRKPFYKDSCLLVNITYYNI